MREVINVSNSEVQLLCQKLVFHLENTEMCVGNITKLWGVPRGGVAIAYMLSSLLKCQVSDDPDSADIIVDDIIDTGETMWRYIDKFNKPFFALINQSHIPEKEKKWYVFPWEKSEVGSKEDIIIRQLEAIGEDPMRDGLRRTPSRVVKMWDEIFSGYGKDSKDILNVSFENDSGYGGMIMLRGMQFYSTCEHHLIPFMGKVTVGYIPKTNGKVVGVSKLARLVDMYARRLQIQERLTAQIADAINEHLSPQGVGVVMDAQHLCMKQRGVRQQGESVMRTAEMRGMFRESAALRAEFMNGVL